MKRTLLCALLALCLVSAAAAAQAPQKGTADDPYLLGETCAFTAEVLADGSPRTVADEAGYQSVEMALTLYNYLTPDYFAQNYGRFYKLSGTEAGALIALENRGKTGVVPQNAFWVTVQSADGAQQTGYQLMDAPLGGNYGVRIEPGERKLLCKRFDQQPGQEARYLVLTYCVDGQAHSRYFLLEERKAYPQLQRGSRGEEVTALQQRLIDLGYLDDDADGIFGPNTEAAVRAARQAAGFEESGAADDAFQFALYAQSFPQASAQT